ncbi:hypothetical protein [Kitasatospora camelliae]|uniref:Secreted protein n=1 Tax=Kitasatospora camelliae TaxID=3156397 RepID=A0AAU8JV46_9ACTN
MRTTMKLAALTFAAAALFGTTTGTAEAYGGLGDWFSWGSTQSNECSTSTGTITDTSVAAQTGDISFSTDCINFDNTGKAHQSNECDTVAGITTVLSGNAPTGDVSGETRCANISLNPWSGGWEG